MQAPKPYIHDPYGDLSILDPPEGSCRHPNPYNQDPPFMIHSGSTIQDTFRIHHSGYIQDPFGIHHSGAIISGSIIQDPSGDPCILDPPGDAGMQNHTFRIHKGIYSTTQGKVRRFTGMFTGSSSLDNVFTDIFILIIWFTCLSLSCGYTRPCLDCKDTGTSAHPCAFPCYLLLPFPAMLFATTFPRSVICYYLSPLCYLLLF